MSRKRIFIFGALTLIVAAGFLAMSTSAVAVPLPSAGPNSPQSADQSNGGTPFVIKWGVTHHDGTTEFPPANIKSSDNQYAQADLDHGKVSRLLLATNFGFNIPSDATIVGVKVNVEKKDSSDDNRIKDYWIALLKSGYMVSSNKASGAYWAHSDATSTYGGNNDLWGLTTLTPAFVNSPDFGVAFSAQNVSDNGSERKANVDNITVTVYYAPAVPTPTPTPTPVVTPTPTPDTATPTPTPTPEVTATPTPSPVLTSANITSDASIIGDLTGATLTTTGKTGVENMHTLNVTNVVVTNGPLPKDDYPFNLQAGADQQKSLTDYFVNKGWPTNYLDQINSEIGGTAPFFYLASDGSGNYGLVDGFQKALGAGDEPLVIDDDYPAGTYSYSGNVNGVTVNVPLSIIAPTPTPAPVVTATPTPDVSPTPTDVSTPTPTPTDSVSPTPTPDVTAEPTPTPEATATPTPEITPTPTPTDTSSPTPTPDITPTPTPGDETSPTPTPEVTATPTPTPEITPTPTPDSGGGGGTGYVNWNATSTGGQVLGTSTVASSIAATPTSTPGGEIGEGLAPTHRIARRRTGNAAADQAVTSRVRINTQLADGYNPTVSATTAEATGTPSGQKNDQLANAASANFFGQTSTRVGLGLLILILVYLGYLYFRGGQDA